MLRLLPLLWPAPPLGLALDVIDRQGWMACMRVDVCLCLCLCVCVARTCHPSTTPVGYRCCPNKRWSDGMD